MDKKIIINYFDQSLNLCSCVDGISPEGIKNKYLTHRSSHAHYRASCNVLTTGVDIDFTVHLIKPSKVNKLSQLCKQGHLVI